MNDRVFRIMMYVIMYITMFNLFAYLDPPDPYAIYTNPYDYLNAKLIDSFVAGIIGLLMGAFFEIKRIHD